MPAQVTAPAKVETNAAILGVMPEDSRPNAAPAQATTDTTSPTTEQGTWSYQTRAVQSAIPRGLGETIGFPIHSAAAFQFSNLAEARDEFIHGAGYSYSRIQNPTVERLEERISQLEGANSSLALATGQAASLISLLSICRAGDHIVSGSSLFGGSVGLLQNVMPLMGINVSFTDGTPTGMQAALQPNTRLLWAEMISNPSGQIADVAALADVAHNHGAVLAIDNTVGGAGYLCRPLEHGADIVTQSLTKWAGGHGNALGGAVSLPTKVELSDNPIFSEGADSLLSKMGDKSLAWRQRWLGATQLGMSLSPFNAFLLAQGLETIALRLQQECHTALALAKWLHNHAKVGAVSYCGLPEHPSYQLAQKYLPKGAGAILTFEVPDPEQFLSNLQLLRIAPNLGDTRTLVVHPWTTTHGRIPKSQRLAAGVSSQTIRMSVGLEALADLQADIEQAL